MKIRLAFEPGDGHELGMHDVVDDFSKVNAAMDTDDKSQIIRRGTLNDDDRKWMEQNIRSRFPPMRNVI